MSRLSPAIELGTYNQGELGVYGRPETEYIEGRDNPYKKLIDAGRNDLRYFERLETVENLITLMHQTPDPGIIEVSAYPTIDRRPDRKLEFLEDTLTFLLTGRRRVPLEQWMILVDDGNRYMSHTERADCIARIKELRQQMRHCKYVGSQYSDTATYISMWCEKPDGVQDMAYSLYFYSMSTAETNK